MRDAGAQPVPLQLRTSSREPPGSPPTRTGRSGGGRGHVAEETANGWGAVAAFEAEFCALGGSVQRIWTPPFFADGALLRQVPASVDGVAVLVRVPFGTPHRSSAHTSRAIPDATRSLLLGLWLYAPSSGRDYAALWPRVATASSGTSSGMPDPRHALRTRPIARPSHSAFPGPAAAGLRRNPSVVPYYTAVDALLQALEKIDGAARRGSRALRTALASLRLETPTGAGAPGRQPPGHRAGDALRADGSASPGPLVQPVRRIPAVDETLGGLFAANSLAHARARTSARAPRRRPGRAEIRSRAAGSSR